MYKKGFKYCMNTTFKSIFHMNINWSWNEYPLLLIRKTCLCSQNCLMKNLPLVLVWGINIPYAFALSSMCFDVFTWALSFVWLQLWILFLLFLTTTVTFKAHVAHIGHSPGQISATWKSLLVLYLTFVTLRD